MTHQCHCCGREFARHEMHDLRVMRPLSRECIAKLRAMPRTIRSGPKRELSWMVRTAIGGGR